MGRYIDACVRLCMRCVEKITRLPRWRTSCTGQEFPLSLFSGQQPLEPATRRVSLN